MVSCSACRIVLVDDEPMVAAAIQAFFALETDHEVVPFDCPFRALAYLDDNAADVVIADLVMSAMSGEEFFQEVERRHPNLPRLLLTGCCDERRMEQVDSLGLAGSIDKPWCNEELRRLIETVAESRAQARSTPVPAADDQR